ncbi:MAG: hypothetical protein WC584_03305 [Candidatus Pacearchaeota archaeon]
MTEELSKLEVGIVSGVVGISAGIIMGLAAYTYGRPNVDNGKVFQREQGKPAVMRIYKSGSDGVLVENPEKKGEYILMSKYLDGIKNKADRKIEEAEIYKTVRWYEE